MALQNKGQSVDAWMNAWDGLNSQSEIVMLDYHVPRQWV
jgi:hypothetical protein